MSSDVGTPIVLPVGHYLGAFHPAADQPPSHHVVRMGWEPVRLDDDAELDVWGLAHGLPAELDHGPWTRASLLKAAAEAGHADVTDALERLLDLGVVVEVAVEGAEAREFAEQHRIQPLLIGLGHPPGEPFEAIGVPGLTVALHAAPRVFEVWQWAHLWPDLWSACEGLAEANRDLGQLDPAATDPAQVLTFVLGAVQTLVANGAAYLDHRPRPAPR